MHTGNSNNEFRLLIQFY